MPEPHVYYSPALKSWVLGDDWVTGINGATMTIPAGYLWDMASVPRFLGAWIQKFDLGTASPLCHDIGYQNGGHWPSYPALTWTRSKVDHLFYTMMKCEGVGWRRHPAFWAVRWFGWLAWKRKANQKAGDPRRDVPAPDARPPAWLH